ncbi:MAG TPA: DUF2855 family protein [Streptosporangiaceae bacterium]|nr:DUF2855 family protein [Streptosporangiaceae bacterium]
MRTIEVRRDAISRTRAVTEAEPHPADGQAVLRVERFSLSANNVTYARLGDELGYWRFFPAADGWGRLPVWAYAEVTASNCAGVSVGRRVLGFFPMSDCLLVTPARVHPGGFAAGCEHRRDLPGVYNAYRWLDADPSYDPALAGQQLVLRPSFWLSFLFDEHLRDNHDFGADIAIISSASSKAALGIAHLLAQRVLTIGLTAPQRVEPLRALRIYDRVEAYDAASGLPAEPAIFADLAGDTGLRAAVHDRLGGALRYSALLGATRGGALALDEGLPGLRPELFFAPDQLRDRARRQGFAALDHRFAAALADFATRSGPWLDLVSVTGAEPVQAAYRELLDGTLPSASALICRISPGQAGV